MMDWYNKYRNRPEFMDNFESEQDYVDAMFIMIVMFNFGRYMRPDELRDEDCLPTGEHRSVTE